MKGLEIKVKYHVDGLEPLQILEKGDWIDLRAAEDVTFVPLEFKLISLGVSIQLPYGYEAIVVPRSSTFKNFGLLQVNSMGVIDNSYCGDNDIWRFPALAFRNVTIHKNDRICQFRILRSMEKEAINIQTVDRLESKSRGGFGSTGIK